VQEHGAVSPQIRPGLSEAEPRPWTALHLYCLCRLVQPVNWWVRGNQTALSPHWERPIIVPFSYMLYTFTFYLLHGKIQGSENKLCFPLHWWDCSYSSGRRTALIIKNFLLCITLISSFFLPRAYAISPNPVKTVKTPVIANSSQETTIYTKSELQELVNQTPYPEIFDKLIPCESQWTDIARIDSNGKMSYGILQFQESTWLEFAPLAGVSSTPMNPQAALKVASYMISKGELHRWTCAHLEGLTT